MSHNYVIQWYAIALIAEIFMFKLHYLPVYEQDIKKSIFSIIGQ